MGKAIVEFAGWSGQLGSGDEASMAERPVHWHEGMFLRPHHFQAAQRHWFHLADQSEKWDLHYNWGIRSIEIDENALANFRLVVRSLKVRLRDGTLVSGAEDGDPAPLDLKDAFERESNLMVFLGVPRFSLGKPNVSAEGPVDGARYRVDAADLEDENTGINPQSVSLRRLNFKLLLSKDDKAGYEVIPIARIEKSTRPDASPQLDKSYIPPLLACDAWKPLAIDILEVIHNRIGTVSRQLAEQVMSGGITFESHSGSDRLIYELLRVLNEEYTTLSILAFAQGIHPLTAYTELCRFVGRLAIFNDKTRRWPDDLPPYDHDDLGRCFYFVKRYFDDVVKVKRKYEERHFEGAGYRMQVNLEPSWLEPAWQMFIGVISPLSPADCDSLITSKFDMKVASSPRVDDIYRRGTNGLKFVYSQRPPRVLPEKGRTYFEIDRQSNADEWQHVQKTLTLAIRFNERLIAGNIEGQRLLTIRSSGENIPMQFVLYMLPADAK